MFFTIFAGVENGRFSRWKCLFFQFICRRIRTHIPVLAGAQIGRMLIWKRSWSFWSLISKMKVTCMLIACFVFWFFAVNAFQFLYCGIRKQHIFIIIGAQNGRISCWNNVIFFWKICILKLNFQEQNQLYANCLFHILSLYRKCFLYQFLIGCKRMHILTGDQTRRIISWKKIIFCRK